MSARDGTIAPLARSATDRILIADDMEDNVWLLQALLTQSGYEQVHSTTDSREVMQMYAELQPDIVLLDVHMPGVDGLTLIRELRAIPDGTFLPIVMLTGDLSSKVKRDALEAGASDFISKPYDATEVLLRVRNLLSLRSLHSRLRDENMTLEARVKERTDALAASRIEVLERLAMATEARDDLTGEHTRRVGVLAGELAERIGLPSEQVELIRRAAPVHDIGKIAIPDSVLHKQGALNAARNRGDARAHDDRREHSLRWRQLARHRRGTHRGESSRAMGRTRLSVPAQGRGDSDRGAHHGGRGFLRRADSRSSVPSRRAARVRASGHRARCRHTVRSGRRRGDAASPIGRKHEAGRGQWGRSAVISFHS